mgnify:CR=1 FL=1
MFSYISSLLIPCRTSHLPMTLCSVCSCSPYSLWGISFLPNLQISPPDTILTWIISTVPLINTPKLIVLYFSFQVTSDTEKLYLKGKRKLQVWHKWCALQSQKIPNTGCWYCKPDLSFQENKSEKRESQAANVNKYKTGRARNKVYRKQVSQKEKYKILSNMIDKNKTFTTHLVSKLQNRDGIGGKM